MWDSIYPFFDWANETAISQAIRSSQWIFAITEVFHLLGLTVLLGTVLIIALRIFGFVLQYRTVKQVATEFAPWSAGALATVVTSGLLLFMSEATKCWGNTSFRYKMLFLFLALIFQFTVMRKVSRAEEGRFTPLVGKLTAIVAVALWFSVGAAGRAIAFY